MAKYYLDNPESQWPAWGMFQLDKIVHLRSRLESKGSQIKKQNGIPILTGMQKLPKPSRFQNSFTASFVAKGNEKVKTQKISKTTPKASPLHPPRNTTSKHWPRHQHIIRNQLGH